MNKEGVINILLVDDRPENLLTLEAIIDSEEYNLIKASSGEEALKYLLKLDFAAILLDVQMPGMDGIRTAKIIKAREKTKHIPILFITANHLDSDHIFMGYSVGAIDCILKPIDPFIVKSKVDSFIDIYKLHVQLKRQTKELEEKNNQLQERNNELIKLSTDLGRSEAIANIIRNTSLDTMILFDNKGTILLANPMIKNMFLYEEQDLINKLLSMLFLEDILEEIQEDFLSNKRKTVIGVRRDGTTFYGEIHVGRQVINDEIIYSCTIRDISDRKKYEEMAEFMANHDPLTYLPNITYFNKKLVEEIQQAKLTNRTFGMMYLDIDQFKFVNDSLGHLVGDKLLIEVSKRLVNTLREKDVVARIGGDEFNILLPDSHREDALQVAENILYMFKQPLYIDQYELNITTSIGLSVFPYDGDGPVEIVRNADIALNRAKKLGKDHIQFYHAGLNIQSYRNFAMQNDLRKALSKNELEINYQPRVDLRTGMIAGFNGEIQWNHPNWGIILSKELLPMLEVTGTNTKIWLWYFKSICEQLTKWNQEGYPPVRIGVFYTNQQFLQKGLIKSIHEILQEANINPSQIEIQILEETFQEYEGAVINILNQLNELGFRITLYNFGTGHLSIRYISHFPIKGISMAKVFAERLLTTDGNSSLYVTTVQSIVDLQYDVMATEVESIEQLASLKELGCYIVSGPIVNTGFHNLHSEEILASNISFSLNLERFIIGNQEPKLDQSLPTQSEKDNMADVSLKEALQQIQHKFSMSKREMDVFELILDGFTNKEIGEKLFISEHTVKNHVTRIFNKMGVNDRVQAIKILYQTYTNDHR